MPRGMYRSRSLRRVKVKLPGNRVTIHYKKRKPNAAKCASCKKPLRGVPRARASDLKRMAKTEKRPERPYGGYLCHKCLQKKLFEEIVMNAL